MTNKDWYPSAIGAAMLGMILVIPGDMQRWDFSSIYDWGVAPIETTIEFTEPDWSEDYVISMETSEWEIPPPVHLEDWEYLHGWIQNNVGVIAPINRLEGNEREDLLCLAINIYHEARGSSVADQVATANVVINRAQHWAWSDRICEVVWEDRQFSWTHDRIPDNPYNRTAWLESQIIVWNIYRGYYQDNTDGATHYHATYVNPAWSGYGRNQIQIGAHIYMQMEGGGR